VVVAAYWDLSSECGSCWFLTFLLTCEGYARYSGYHSQVVCPWSWIFKFDIVYIHSSPCWCYCYVVATLSESELILILIFIFLMSNFNGKVQLYVNYI
jgi:hypothetical protein